MEYLFYGWYGGSPETWKRADSTSIAYFSGLTYKAKAYTETQYALFSSLVLLPARFIGGFSGDVVDAQGYVFFFIYTAMPGIPAIMLILYLMKRNSMENAPPLIKNTILVK